MKRKTTQASFIKATKWQYYKTYTNTTTGINAMNSDIKYKTSGPYVKWEAHIEVVTFGDVIVRVVFVRVRPIKSNEKWWCGT